MSDRASRRDAVNRAFAHNCQAVTNMDIRAFDPDDESAVIHLWDRCGLTRSWNDPKKDIRRKLHVQAEMFLVGVVGGEIVATAMAGYDGHRGWVNYLAVDPEHQRKGHGRAIMAEAERMLDEAGCPKINVQIRSSNGAAIGFYRAIGFADDEVVSMGKRLENDGPAA